MAMCPFYWCPSLIIGYPCHSLTATNLSDVCRLDWCDPGVWRCQLKTSWCCYCCWGWWWATYCQHFGRDFDAEDCSRYRGWGLVKITKLKISWNFDTEVWSRFWSWSLVATDWSKFWARPLVEILKLKFDQDLCDMTYRSYFDRQNLTLGSVVPSAMF